MLAKRSTMGVLVLLFLFSITAVHAAKPEGEFVGKADHSESFWERWFGRSEKLDKKELDDTLGSKKEKQKQNKDKEKTKHYFTESERSYIKDYYRRDGDDKADKKYKKNKDKQVPYGLQKKLDRGGQLPPGWEAKVARGEVLDSDILRYSERIPHELARRLPTIRDGEEVRRVGNKVVRVLEGNGTVIDVIDLADVLLR
jgi:hypothetical protein